MRVYLRAKSRRCAAVALRNAPAGAVTLPYRWLRAAHKIAPNGAWLPDVSYYRLDRTERSRPFPTNSPKVRNHPIRFIDSLHLPPKGKAFLLYGYFFFALRIVTKSAGRGGYTGAVTKR